MHPYRLPHLRELHKVTPSLSHNRRRTPHSAERALVRDSAGVPGHLLQLHAGVEDAKKNGAPQVRHVLPQRGRAQRVLREGRGRARQDAAPAVARVPARRAPGPGAERRPPLRRPARGSGRAPDGRGGRGRYGAGVSVVGV